MDNKNNNCKKLHFYACNGKQSNCDFNGKGGKDCIHRIPWRHIATCANPFAIREADAKIENEFTKIACDTCRTLKKDNKGSNCKGCKWTRDRLYEIIESTNQL